MCAMGWKKPRVVLRSAYARSTLVSSALPSVVLSTVWLSVPMAVSTSLSMTRAMAELWSPSERSMRVV